MSNQQSDRIVLVQSPETSGLAIAGLVFSCLGWLSCGLLSIPGALLSLAGLFCPGPKGTAVAGLIVGFPGVAFFIFVGLGMLMAMLGLATAPITLQSQGEEFRVEATTELPVGLGQSESSLNLDPAELADEEQQEQREVEQRFEEMESAAIRDYKQERYDEFLANNPRPQEPELLFRSWSAKGQTREARYVQSTVNSVQLLLRDSSTVNVFRSDLSEEDNQYIVAYKKILRRYEEELAAWTDREQLYRPD